MQGFFIKPTKKAVKIVIKNKIYFYTNVNFFTQMPRKK